VALGYKEIPGLFALTVSRRNKDTMKKRFVDVLWLSVFLLAMAFSRPVCADSPSLEYLKTNLASVQQLLTDPKLAGDEQLFQRRKLVRAVLQQLFDFPEMSRRSLGANAHRYKDRLEEFTPLFVDFLEHSYMGTLEKNGDAKIQYVKETLDGENRQISTKTKLKDGSEYSVDYKLYLSPAGWRVYDVIVEGISLVNNYRSQFDRVLNKKSFDALLQDLREKRAMFNY
jgi:phospholipid transport system substrate-binding protein